MSPVVHGSSISLAPIIEEEVVQSREAVLIMKKLKSVLHRGVEHYLTYESIILPRNTLLRASQDVLDLSMNKPGGLHGVVIDLILEEEKGCSKRLAQVVADPQADAKTILKLTLYKDPISDDTTLHINSSYAIKRCCKP